MGGVGRPSLREGPRVSKSQLVRIAASLIGHQGVSKTSMRQIAEEARVSLASVQYHFRTKESLLVAVIDELILPNERSRSSEGLSIADYFRAGVFDRLSQTLEAPGLTGKILVGEDADEASLLDYLSDQVQPVIENDRRRILNAIKSGDLRKIYPPALMAIMGVAMPVLTSSAKAIRKFIGLDISNTRDRNKLAAGIADIILHGILPRAEETQS